MFVPMPRLLVVGSILVFLTSCAPLQKAEEPAWTTGWESGDYYAPVQTDL